MKRLNNKGFTLTELLVAIAILGLLTAMAIPTLRNVQTRNNDKNYESYTKMILSASKLYVDSYNDILFRDQEQKEIRLKEDLYDKGLVNDLGVNGSTCEENTSVYVRRDDSNHYHYCIKITCTQGNKKVYTNDTCKDNDEMYEIPEDPVPEEEEVEPEDPESEDEPVPEEIEPEEEEENPIPPGTLSCTLKVTASTVSISSNLTGYSYGMNKTGTAAYNSTKSLSISTGTFYGYVKDSYGRTAVCSKTIVAKNKNYSKTTKKCVSYVKNYTKKTTKCVSYVANYTKKTRKCTYTAKTSGCKKLASTNSNTSCTPSKAGSYVYSNCNVSMRTCTRCTCSISYNYGSTSTSTVSSCSSTTNKTCTKSNQGYAYTTCTANYATKWGSTSSSTVTSCSAKSSSCGTAGNIKVTCSKNYGTKWGTSTTTTVSTCSASSPSCGTEGNVYVSCTANYTCPSGSTAITDSNAYCKK